MTSSINTFFVCSIYQLLWQNSAGTWVIFLNFFQRLSMRYIWVPHFPAGPGELLVSEWDITVLSDGAGAAQLAVRACVPSFHLKSNRVKWHSAGVVWTSSTAWSYMVSVLKNAPHHPLPEAIPAPLQVSLLPHCPRLSSAHCPLRPICSCTFRVYL